MSCAEQQKPSNITYLKNALFFHENVKKLLTNFEVTKLLFMNEVIFSSENTNFFSH